MPAFPHLDIILPPTQDLTSPERALRTNWRCGEDWFFDDDPDDAAVGEEPTPIPAIVRQGRWLVQCPWCREATYAPYADKRTFCPNCRHETDDAIDAGAQGVWVAVDWPSVQDIADIEETLGERPLSDQSWAPPMTVAALIAETAALATLAELVRAALED